jgi:hypothetical protein
LKVRWGIFGIHSQDSLGWERVASNYYNRISAIPLAGCRTAEEFVSALARPRASTQSLPAIAVVQT